MNVPLPNPRMGTWRVSPERPLELEQLDELSHWCFYREEPDGKKKPFTNGGPFGANVNEQLGWTSRENAENLKQRFNGDGIGFLLGKIDRIISCPYLCGIDLDGVLDEATGDLLPDADHAKQICELLKDTYAEVSPSGTGLHFMFLRMIARPFKTMNPTRGPKQEIKLACEGLYLTFTGDCFEDHPSQLAVLDTERWAKLTAIINAYAPKPETHGSGSVEPQDVVLDGDDQDITPELLTARAKSSNRATRDKVKRLIEAREYEPSDKASDCSGSGLAFSMCGFLANLGFERSQIETAIGAKWQPEEIKAWVEKQGRDLSRQLRNMFEDQREGIEPLEARIEAARRRISKRHSEAGDAGEVDKSHLPRIEMREGDLPAIVDAAEAALIKACKDDPFTGLYQRGAFIVRRGVEITVRSDDHERVEVVQPMPIKDHALREEMTSTANFLRYDGRRKGWRQDDAPMDVVRTYEQRCGRWRLPDLRGIVSTPTLRSDGTILETPGYDLRTRLLYDPNGTSFPPIPTSPTRADAGAALKILEELIEECPFVEQEHRSVALSGILTAVIRQSIAQAPLHGFNAPTPGSGKSFLIDLACLVATGRTAPHMNAGKDEVEFEKRLGAKILAGSHIISLDNCKHPIGGETLETMLSQEFISPRILGSSSTPTMPTNVMVFASGNNLTIRGDTARRALRCTLDPQLERPEQREFKRNPAAMVRANRPAYVVAVLTVIRAWVVAREAGHKLDIPKLNGFHEWSSLVREPLVWLGCADPVKTIEEIRNDDPELASLSAVIAGWQEADPEGDELKTSELIELAREPDDGGFPPGGQSAEPWKPLHAALYEALAEVALRGRDISPVALGRWLKQNAGRPVGGYKITSRLDRVSKQPKWSLVVAKS